MIRVREEMGGLREREIEMWESARPKQAEGPVHTQIYV